MFRLCTFRRCAQLASSEALASRERYTRQLYFVVANLPATGSEVASVFNALNESMGDKADCTVYGFDSPLHALSEVNDTHYIAGGKRVVPCSWATVLPSIASEIPPEGVVEQQFVELIRRVLPDFSANAFPGVGVANWAQRHFPHLLLLSKARSSPVHVFQRAPPRMSPKAEAIASSLAKLDRAKLPIWTDFRSIRELLPSNVAPAEGHWSEFLADPDIREHFDVSAEVLLSLGTTYSETTVFVDGNSVSPSAVQQALSKLKAPTSRTTTVHVYRRSSAPPHTSDDHIVGAFLETEHMITAAIAQAATQPGAKRNSIVVLCSEEQKKAFNDSLADLQDVMDVSVTTA